MTKAAVAQETAEADPAGRSVAPNASVVTVGDLVREVAASLVAAGVALPALEARLIVGHGLRLDPARVFAYPERPVAAAPVGAVCDLAARRGHGEPLAYILGEREFWSLPIRVTPDVLIPRPETELIVETALALHGAEDGSPRILDIGSGSGCILLALLSELPAARGVGVDVSEAALRVARDNAHRLALAPRCDFVCCDWGSAVAGTFDLVVANPPYIDDAGFASLTPEIRAFEPTTALRGGPDGLDAFRAVGRDLRRLLGTGGCAVVEVGFGQARRVEILFAEAGLRTIRVSRDLAGHERCLTLAAI
ncbi:MAG: peptide chain release factor N(5)-glutamine methyltransferase [Rhodospirillales bacterium]|nr:peptide chain release factor N(5)-glutamine methyltransferase [Rhodospirillales bacterium]